MHRKTTEKNRYTQLIYRPFWIILSCLVVILGIALAVLISASWRALHRTQPLKAHMAMIEEIHRYSVALANLDLERNSLPTDRQIAEFDRISEGLMRLIDTSKILSDEARSPLRQAAVTLKAMKASASNDFRSVQKNMQSALQVEVGIQNNLLHLLARDNQLELKTTTFISITLPLLALLMLFFLRHRILRPLDNLSHLIAQVGRQELPTVPLNKLDPLLKPVFKDFSHLVERLSELEQAQQKHQRELEDKVRHATQSLLEYQQTLAQSERLAAVGELTAGLAHELRNPLAGIHMALANLKNEMNDDDKSARLTLVMEELERVTKLLKQVLNQSRHRPEAASRFKLAEMLHSLLQLVRYQIPARIEIEQRVSEDMQCKLPQGRLRQVLLNLILNAAQSIGKAPGLICIDASFSETRLAIQVSDNGKGFPQELMEAGVQTFMSGHEHGTGLGLSIVRRFCYEQGGELRLSNPNSGGACAEMMLPQRVQDGQ